MSDHTDKQDQSTGPTLSSDTQVTSNRRRFAKSGLLGGAVLMSLSGRSALGSGSYGFSQNCSVDTLFSVYNGGSQYDFDVTQCEYGCTPGFWQDPTNDKPSNDAAWTKIGQLTGWTQSTLIEVVFTAVSSEAYGAGFLDQNKIKGTTLNDILREANSAEAYVKQSVRHGLAAILNSLMMGFYYTSGYSPQSIKDWFNQAWTNYLSDPTNTLYQNELDTIHQTFVVLNENRTCPIGGADTTGNPFYQDDFRQKINTY